MLTQVLTWVLSYDGEQPPEPLAITAAGAALAVSGARSYLAVSAQQLHFLQSNHWRFVILLQLLLR